MLPQRWRIVTIFVLVVILSDCATSTDTAVSGNAGSADTGPTNSTDLDERLSLGGKRVRPANRLARDFRSENREIVTR